MSPRVVEMFERGMTASEIAARTGSTLDRINNALKLNGCLRGVSDEVLRRVVELRHGGETYRGIMKKTGLAKRSVQDAIAYASRHGASVLDPESARNDIRAEKEAIRKRYARDIRALLLFDLHSPYTHRTALETALKEKGPFDLIVLGGDMMNFGAFSRFRQDDDATIKSEMDAAREVQEMIAAKAPSTWAIMGNHDERPEKSIADQLAQLMRQLDEGGRRIALDAVRKLSIHLNRATPLVHVHHDWWLMLGNESRPNMVTHADRYTRARLSTPTNVYRYFLERQFRPQSVCIGHLHRYAPWTPIEGCWVSEMPCLCNRMKYAESSKAAGGAWHLGYGILRLDRNGDFVPNDSRVVWGGAL